MKSGKAKVILWSVFALKLKGKEPIAVAMNIDITSKKKSEKNIKEINQQLERFSKISADILLIDNEKCSSNISPNQSSKFRISTEFLSLIL
jgi:hypothetical protein